jgi:hypothetical protein
MLVLAGWLVQRLVRVVADRSRRRGRCHIEDNAVLWKGGSCVPKMGQKFEHGVAESDGGLC